MTYSTQERENIIQRLGKEIDIIEKILKPRSASILEKSQIDRLKKLKADAEILRKKLVNDEFEIAIVGLEKAGKSTLANALMENNLLPSDDRRCTFTSTQIQYAEDEHATVKFYTLDEFNRDFTDKMKKLGVPNADRYSFHTIRIDEYDKIYMECVSDDKKSLYGQSINEDIRASIQNCDSLLRLLGRPDVIFSSGFLDELHSYITEESKARAAKQVKIYSRQLREMKNAVIYDVPGFNSPTELHRLQTLERMKSADAIVVVANGCNPSLTRESLQILRESDSDGNCLTDKLFVFANKIEGSRDIRNNIEETYKEWIDVQRFVKHENKRRIIFGSALAHLQDAGIDNDRRVLNTFNERRTELPDGDGIETMRRKLEEYNHNERFEVLKHRVNRIKSAIEELFEEIRNNCGCEQLEKYRSPAAVQMILDMVRTVRLTVKERLKNLMIEIRNDMESMPLSQQIKDNIANNVTIEKYHVTDEEIDTERKESRHASGYAEVRTIEHNVRWKKFNSMYDDFINEIIEVADNRHIGYSDRILDEFLSAMDVATNSSLRGEIKSLLSKDLAAFRSEFDHSSAHNTQYYRTLIERFSRDLYEILIYSPYSEERLEQFYSSRDNYFSLSVFYRKNNDDYAYIDTAPRNQPLCAMLLFHNRDAMQIRNGNATPSLINDIGKAIGIDKDTIIPSDVIEIVTKILQELGGRSDIILQNVQKRFSDIVHSEYSDEFRFKLLKQVLMNVLNHPEFRISISDKDAYTQYYKKFHSELRNGRQYSVDDIKTDFNDDIITLQDVLQNAFIRAINMEKPFIAKEQKSIDDIIDKYIDSEKFECFLNENFHLIRYEKSLELDKKRQEQEVKIAIIKELNELFVD